MTTLLEDKTNNNIWDSIDDVIPIIKASRESKWSWVRNPRCKYIELRIDMRDGGCIIRDRNGTRIDPTELTYQFDKEKEKGK